MIGYIIVYILYGALRNSKEMMQAVVLLQCSMLQISFWHLPKVL